MSDESYSDINDYFKYIIKKHETVYHNPPIRRYVNRIESRATFKIKTIYYLELLNPETIKLLGSNKSKQLKIRMGKCPLIRNY